jgi:hypothetical protein
MLDNYHHNYCWIELHLELIFYQKIYFMPCVNFIVDYYLFGVFLLT